MAKSTSPKSADLSLMNEEDALAITLCKGEVVARVLNDEADTLGFTILSKWLSDRPSIAIQKLIKDTGNAQVETLVIMTAPALKAITTAPTPALKTIKNVVKKLAKIAKIKAEKKPRKVAAASGIERDSSTEQGLIAKHGEKIVPGTLRFETEGKYAGKRTVEIRCLKLLVAEEDGSGYDWADNEYTDQTRRIATSDLFQVHGTEADHHEKRKADRRFAHKMRAAGLTK